MVEREIGGYLELERFQGEALHGDLIALGSGRACLTYLIELRSIRSIWLPDYMCDSVRRTCEGLSVGVRTYSVGPSLSPVYDFEPAEGDWLYLSDYFGFLSADQVEFALDFFGGRLIVDEVQGFFREPWSGVDTLYSCRKWFGVPDGGYLATSKGEVLGRSLPAARSADRMVHLLGRFEGSASDYFKLYHEAEESLEGESLETMSLLAANLLRAVDYDRVREARRLNWAVLDSVLGDENLLWEELNRHMPEVPFMYPLRVDNPVGLRERLAEMGVYIPTLWPNVLCDSTAGFVARSNTAGILPLPIDQRYGEEDMHMLINRIRALV